MNEDYEKIISADKDDDYDSVSTGLPNLDRQIGPVRGFPIGRVTLLTGRYSTGKSSLALFALVMGYWADDVMILVQSMVGGVFGFAALWLLGQGYLAWRGQEGLGGGDPPLLGAIGLWLGPLGVIHTLLVASLGGLAVAAVLWRAGREVRPDTMLPLGTLLAVAAWSVFLWQGL